MKRVQKSARTQNKETLFSRIAKSDNQTLHKVQELFSEYGIPKAKDRFDLYRKLVILCKRERENIIPKLVEIHPDRKFFESYYTAIQNQKIDELQSENERKIASLEEKIKELNSQVFKPRHYSDDGTLEKGNKEINYMPYLVTLGAIGLLGVTMIAITNKKD